VNEKGTTVTDSLKQYRAARARKSGAKNPDDVYVDAAWFEDQLHRIKVPQRQLAKLMGVDPAAVSLLKQGKRCLTLIEADYLSHLLGVSVAEVAARMGTMTKEELDAAEKWARGFHADPTGLTGEARGAGGSGVGGDGPALIPLSGTIDDKREVHPDLHHELTDQQVPALPMPGRGGCAAYRFQTNDAMDGWIAYVPAIQQFGVPAELLGQLCYVVTDDGEGPRYEADTRYDERGFLRYVRKGYLPGRYFLSETPNEKGTQHKVKASAPVVWMFNGGL
jgi:transcriptional regulator with XRE-family HTH domain